MDDDKEFAELIKDRFSKLPRVVQQAIISADVEKRMRELAENNKLHLDQYDALENEVQLTLLGVEPIEDLQKNIKEEVGVSDETAQTLTEQVSKIIFEPIRQELERQLENPDAKALKLTGVEQAGQDAIKSEAVAPVVPTTPPVAPATPPTPPNEEKVVRAPVSESYKPGQTSTERKEVHEDPYREPPA